MYLGKLKYLGTMLPDTLLAGVAKEPTQECHLSSLVLSGCMPTSGNKEDCLCLLLQ